MLGLKELGDEMNRRFIETLDPHYSIQHWGWPATLMRAITAAYAETDYFEKVILNILSKQLFYKNTLRNKPYF